jgi:hypothetical protein
MRTTCVIAGLLTCLWSRPLPAVGAVPPPGPPDAALKDLPPFCPGRAQEWGGYKVDPYIRAAAALQGMGRQRAVDYLKAWAKKGADERLIVLCRMLFTARPGAEFRRPGLGAAFFFSGTDSVDADYKNWPLEPIDLVDGVPFLIVWGYTVDGSPELPSEYLAYCIEKCDWSTYRFRAKSRAQKESALKKLLSLEKGKGKLAHEFLRAQLK